MGVKGETSTISMITEPGEVLHVGTMMHLQMIRRQTQGIHLQGSRAARRMAARVEVRGLTRKAAMDGHCAACSSRVDALMVRIVGSLTREILIDAGDRRGACPCAA